MTLTLPKTCSFGGSKTGLVGTIGVTLLDPDGTIHTARSIADIYEIGGGCYGKDITFDDSWLGTIDWDDGGGVPVHAVEGYSYPAVALNDVSPADVNAQVVDVMRVDTIPEMPQQAPPEEPTFVEAMNYTYRKIRNKTETTDSEDAVYDNAGTTKLFRSTISDDGVTFVKQEYVSG